MINIYLKIRSVQKFNEDENKIILKCAEEIPAFKRGYVCDMGCYFELVENDENNIKTTNGYDYFTPYKDTEESLKRAGFDVLIFIPSYEEDLGRITCGNAILSGSMPECDYEEVI